MISNILKSILAISVLIFMNSSVHAELVNCGEHTILDIATESNRDDQGPFANTFNFRLTDDGTSQYLCRGRGTFYISDTSNAYNSIASTILAAFLSGKKIIVYINDSNTKGTTGYEIALINIMK